MILGTFLVDVVLTFRNSYGSLIYGVFHKRLRQVELLAIYVLWCIDVNV